ncbi:hypothetical protein [Rubrimonas cliftonensis]|uniref:Uncharacterized protein n=1 Tax=Rubrimonas cliftonensis TaxID=89524 RepID=A0A1H3WYX4_9RHOB|nr:hypothetical protein [Rubrimonas cliftonensis]SDZ92313.1 hypothetical protein SAMN05444370_102196 [Rubrimonas cliftonensis]
MDSLTPDQAHRAMRGFLEQRLARDPQAEVAQVLSDTAMLPDGRTADPASLREWLDCVADVLSEDAAPRRAAS